MKLTSHTCIVIVTTSPLRNERYSLSPNRFPLGVALRQFPFLIFQTMLWALGVKQKHESEKKQCPNVVPMPCQLRIRVLIIC